MIQTAFVYLQWLEMTRHHLSVLSVKSSLVLMWLSPLGCSTGLVFCFSCITHVHWHCKSLWNLTLIIFVPLNIEHTVPYMTGVGGGFRFPCEFLRSAVCSCCCFWSFFPFFIVSLSFPVSSEIFLHNYNSGVHMSNTMPFRQPHSYLREGQQGVWWYRYCLDFMFHILKCGVHQNVSNKGWLL